jgi:hypothetical protein
LVGGRAFEKDFGRWQQTKRRSKSMTFSVAEGIKSELFVRARFADQNPNNTGPNLLMFLYNLFPFGQESGAVASAAVFSDPAFVPLRDNDEHSQRRC